MHEILRGWNTLATPTSKCGGLTPLTPAVSTLVVYMDDNYSVNYTHHPWMHRIT
jgi:hypothetical protein